MRFTQLQEIDLDNLLLDTGNYRFIKADDQQDCIQRIYNLNRSNFIKMLESIAKDDIDQPPLVLEEGRGKKKTYKVYDGNRRVSALKVLAKPDLGPTPKIIACAEELSEHCKASLKKVQCFVSNDRSLVLKTIYERHAGGEGVSQIKWRAFGTALFRHDNDVASSSGDTEWKAMSLIMDLITHDDEHRNLHENPRYKHSVFKPAVSAAIAEGYLPDTVFHSSQKRLKKQSKTKALALRNQVRSIVDDILTGKISFSRTDAAKGTSVYGDQLHLRKHFADKMKKPNVEGTSNETEKERRRGTSKGSKTLTKHHDSEKIRISLKNLMSDCGVEKPYRLYHSIVVISAKEHTLLVDIGINSFLECLCSLHSRKSEVSTTGYLNKNNLKNRLKLTGEKNLTAAIRYFNEQANENKHSSMQFSGNFQKSISNFRILEPLISALVNEIYSQLQTN